MHLTSMAIDTLRSKGHDITDEEAEALEMAILLHDIGHGPYSHTLEHCLVNDASHEFLSGQFINRLNDELGGRLTLAAKIFANQYEKRFLYQLIVGQLDMDRMDYLRRDSFFTGVSEGAIGHDRIIKMLNVYNDELVVDAKGIYSIEKFLIARRLMYWQVYLHKTVICAEEMLVQIMSRAKELALAGEELFASPALRYFLYNDINKQDFLDDPEVLDQYALLDDVDVMASVKVWSQGSDPVLAPLCKALVNRRLLKVELTKSIPDEEKVAQLKELVVKKYGLPDAKQADYFVFSGSTSNYMYNPERGNIKILFKDGTLTDVASASDMMDISVLSAPVTKYYLCYPKGLM